MDALNLETVTAELSDIAEQLDQMSAVFNDTWPAKLSERVREMALRLIEGSIEPH